MNCQWAAYPYRRSARKVGPQDRRLIACWSTAGSPGPSRQAFEMCWHSEQGQASISVLSRRAIGPVGEPDAMQRLRVGRPQWSRRSSGARRSLIQGDVTAASGKPPWRSGWRRAGWSRAGRARTSSGASVTRSSPYIPPNCTGPCSTPSTARPAPITAPSTSSRVRSVRRSCAAPALSRRSQMVRRWLYHMAQGPLKP